MQDSPSQKLTLLFIIVVHLTIQCDAIAFSVQSCARERLGFRPHNRRCPPLRISEIKLCSLRKSLCSLYPDVRDCLVPQFQCALNSRCIPRRLVCNGFPDCSDGSDEWGCEASSDFTDTDPIHLETVETTSSYITTASFRGNEEETTNMILPEDNPLSPPLMGRMISYSKSNTAMPLSKSTTIPDTKSNTALPSASTMISDSESNTAPSSTLTNTKFSLSEWYTAFSSSSTTKTMIPDTESNTALPSSTSTLISYSESNSAPSSALASTSIFPFELNTTLSSSSTTTKIIPESNTASTIPVTSREMLPTYEANSPFSTLVEKSTILLASPEKNSTHMALTESSVMQSCPENHCMHNAECIVVQGQYHCRCPSPFFGELCEIKLGTERAFYEYTVVIAISMTLTILCIVVISICIYRYKRLSWKFSDKTTRTLSQLTLTSNDVA